jgi:hypothetical protein
MSWPNMKLKNEVIPNFVSIESRPLSPSLLSNFSDRPTITAKQSASHAHLAMASAAALSKTATRVDDKTDLEPVIMETGIIGSPTPPFCYADELLYDGVHRNALDTQYLIALHSRGLVLSCLALALAERGAGVCRCLQL